MVGVTVVGGGGKGRSLVLQEIVKCSGVTILRFKIKGEIIELKCIGR